MDGGASSTDAFRMPAEGEELTTPFSEFVVRYGHTPRLVRNMAAMAGVAAELPPRMEEPYRLVYFVVTDQMRTTIAALRAVLKEGLQAPLRTPTAFIIDELHTLEVFRKQGLATSLTNFVKGIAEAHGVELFVSSEMYIRSFWELRGFEEETSPEVLRACSLDLDDGFNTGASTTLLRAGAAYTEYQPANDERLSITRPFYHGGDGYLAAATAAADAPTLAGSAAFMGQGGAGLESSGYGEGIGASAAAGGAVSGGASAAADVAGDHNRVTGGDGGGGAGGADGETVLPPSSRLLTNERLARHDEEEQAKGLASPWGTLVQSSKTAEATMLSTAGDTAAAKAALATAAATAATQDPSAAVQHTAAGGGWPGAGPGAGPGGAAELPPSPPSPPIGTAAGPAAAAALAATSSSGVGATVAGMLGWTPSDRQIVAATGGTASGGGGGGGGGGIVDRRTLAARGLLAIPSSGSRDSLVDLTGGSRSLAEQDEEQMQLAIAMSLSAAAAEATCGGGGDAAAAAAIARSDGARHDGAVRGGEGETSAGDDTETEEDADYGGQLSGGDADAAAGGIASTAAAAAAAAAAPTSSSARSPVRAGEEHGAGGGDGSGCGGGGGGWGRRTGGVVEDGRGRDSDNDGVTRRLRRRRDESGSSTPGEPSPCGADGAASVGMELGGVGAGRHGNEGRRSSSRDGGDGGNTASLTENVCITAARDVGSGLAVASETTAPHAPRPLDAAAAAAREGSSNRPSSLPPSRPASPCPSSASSCSFTLGPAPSRSRTSTWNQQIPTTVGALGHRDPNSAMTVSKENDPHHHHHQDQARKAVYQPPPRGLGARGQQHQHQATFAGDGGGMIGALGGVVYPTTTAGGTGGADVAGLGAGRFGNVGVGGSGGGLISDGIEPSDVVMRDFGVGSDGLDGGGRLDDKLIAVAGWEGDDDDEELRRVMEASRLSHEEEMIQRATQESQQAAAAAAAAAAAEHLPQPPCNTAAAAPPPPPPSSLPPLSRKGVAATTPTGGGPDVAVLPSFGSLEARNSTGVSVGAGVHGHGSDASGAALPSTCGGAAAAAAASSGGFRAGTGGGAADSAAAAAAGAGAQAPAWLGGWEDGEAVSFTGKGKGKGRCRD